MGTWLRRVGLALLCSLLAGFALGTCLRHEVERPTLYIGSRSPEGTFFERARVDSRTRDIPVNGRPPVLAGGTSPALR